MHDVGESSGSTRSVEHGGGEPRRSPGRATSPPGGAYFASQAKTSLFQNSLFFGFSTQWPSSGKLIICEEGGKEEGERGRDSFLRTSRVPFASRQAVQLSIVSPGTAARSLSADTTVQLPRAKAMAAI